MFFFKLGGFDKKLGIDRDHDRDRTKPIADIFKMLKFYRLTIKPSQKFINVSILSFDPFFKT
jgi:hypothetical protein